MRRNRRTSPPPPRRSGWVFCCCTQSCEPKPETNQSHFSAANQTSVYTLPLKIGWYERYLNSKTLEKHQAARPSCVSRLLEHAWGRKLVERSCSWFWLLHFGDRSEMAVVTTRVMRRSRAKSLWEAMIILAKYEEDTSWATRLEDECDVKVSMSKCVSNRSVFHRKSWRGGGQVLCSQWRCLWRRDSTSMHVIFTRTWKFLAWWR